MHYINAIIGLILGCLALFTIADTATASLFFSSALLALASLKHWRSGVIVWLLAVATTGAMFFFFARFFGQAPHLSPSLADGEALFVPVALLVGAFAMIPVLSEFSCQMKADRDCQLARVKAERDRFKAAQSLLRLGQERPTP